MSRQPIRIRLPFAAAVARALPEALEHRLDHGFEAQALLDVQLRGEAHLGVDDPVRGQVLGALGRHPDECIRGLHDGDRVPERLQVALERARVGGPEEPCGQLGGVA